MCRPDFQYRYLILGADEFGDYVIEDTWSKWTLEELAQGHSKYPCDGL